MTTQLLTGIPGTGKTHHLTERALRYLTDGNDPARLLILAPTRTAAPGPHMPSTCSNEPKPAGYSAA